MKHAAVKPANCLAKLGKGHSLGVQLFDSLQRNEAIRLHTQGLVKLRRENETNLHHIAFAQPVQRAAFPRQDWTPYAAVRYPGFCGFRRPRIVYGYLLPYFLSNNHHHDLLHQIAASKTKNGECQNSLHFVPVCDSFHTLFAGLRAHKT